MSKRFGMFSAGGAQGTRRRALRAATFGLATLMFGILSVGLVGNRPGPHSDRVVFSGYGSSGPESARFTISQITPLTTLTGQFRIAGSVSGLYPGHTSPLVLTVTNPDAFTIVVTSIRTSVIGTRATCPARNLSVSAFSGRLSVPAGHSGTTLVGASLALAAPNACIGSAFRLVYRGLGERR